MKFEFLKTAKEEVKLLCMFSLLLIELPPNHAFTCKGHKSELLDWFVLIKFPESYNYSFISSDNPGSWIQPSSSDIRHNGPIVETLAQSYLAKSQNHGVLVAMYNNDKPGHGSSHYSAHMKGVVTFNISGTGFWLIHSIPHFPRKESYLYPQSGMPYAQSFICVSVPNEYLDIIGQQLFVAWARFYLGVFDSDYIKKSIYWKQIQKQIPPPVALVTHTAVLRSAFKNIIFYHFTKSKHFGKDLYESLVAPELRCDLMVETWNHGNGAYINSSCNNYSVFNVIKFKVLPLSTEFKTSHDHSKWSLGKIKDGKCSFLCVGDINRMTSQFSRGGGTLCFSHLVAHSSMMQMVSSVQPCARNFTECEVSENLHTHSNSVIVVLSISLAGCFCFIIGLVVVYHSHLKQCLLPTVYSRI